MTDILYADLVTAIGMNGLTPGEQYRITDYQTSFYIYDYDTLMPVNTNVTDVGAIEPIIVSALTDSLLDGVAKSTIYPSDILYYTVDQTDAGVFASITGTITRRIDSISKIEMPYDYRAIYVTASSANLSSLPSTAFNVYIGITASGQYPYIYTKTVPILIYGAAQNVSIQVIDDVNGLSMNELYDVEIEMCFAASSNSIMKSCQLASINVGPGLDIIGFIGGHLSNVTTSFATYNVSNPALSNYNPKVGIPGGYFVEMSVLGQSIQCVSTDILIP